MQLKRRILCLLTAACLTASMIGSALAATVETSVIDSSKTASLTVYKYDTTRAGSDGVWDSNAYVSTGEYDGAVNSVLGNPAVVNSSATTNTSYGYAVKGVTFSYLRIADISMRTIGSAGNYEVRAMYGFSQNDESAAFLSAIGLSYANASDSATGVYYFTSDTLNAALKQALETKNTDTKNALEQLVHSYPATAMPQTDEYGKTSASGLPLGLYLMVETAVPDFITVTCNPFLVSLPMTVNSGDSWNYDVTVYPKNQSGAPTLEKTVRESLADTGEHGGSTNDILDGYAHTATASEGDHLDYQIISKLPVITSNATALSEYSFLDTLSKGISYTKSDVKLEWFTDTDCTNLIATWNPGSTLFSVTYDDTANTMLISLTAEGLQQVNRGAGVYDSASIYRGYSECTVRITYGASVNSDSSFTLGDDGNDNRVKLTWRRTNAEYYDILEDDCHVYSFGMDLLKIFSDGEGDVSAVSFVLKNIDDDYYVQAKLLGGNYYVTGHTSSVDEATVFVPQSDGHLRVYGLENNEYTVEELTTDDGYALLRSPIEIVFTREDGALCSTCEKTLVSCSATVNGKSATMDSDHAVVSLTVNNTRTFLLPKTGSYGTWMYVLGGGILSACGVACYFLFRKKDEEENTAE